VRATTFDFAPNFARRPCGSTLVSGIIRLTKGTSGARTRATPANHEQPSPVVLANAGTHNPIAYRCMSGAARMKIS
jgi:hypothetical protein